MSVRRLRARLARLEDLASTAIGQNPVRDRLRLSELEHRIFSRRGLNDVEMREHFKLTMHIQRRDQDLGRLEDLSKKASALTDKERVELAELQRRLTPNPNN